MSAPDQASLIDRLLTDEQIVEGYPNLFGNVNQIRIIRSRGEGWPVYRVRRKPLTDPDDLIEWMKARKEGV